MASCKECLHYDVCSSFESLYMRVILAGNKADERCGLFKNNAVWVDVDERLPEKNGKYIVCNRNGAVYQTKFYIYPENKGGHWGQKDKGKNIIAWMPMPEVCLPFSLPRERKEK